MPVNMSVQKPRKGKGKRNGVDNTAHALREAALDDLVAAIEGKFMKKGSTKSQMEFLERKSICNAIDKAQQTSSPSSRPLPAPKSWNENETVKKDWSHDVKEVGLDSIPHQEYVNKEVFLPKEYCEWKEIAPQRYVRYEQFKGTDEEMDFIVNFFSKMLTEPYSSFTYQYFVCGWPDLCVTAYGVESATVPDDSVKGERVGAIVSRVTQKSLLEPLRGYVAMFAVGKNFRGYRLGSHLVRLTVELMKAKDCDLVYLETPLSNTRALDLYHHLGFCKTKFLPRYYLDHSDAYRMVLWLRKPHIRHEEGEEGNASSILPSKYTAILKE